MEFAAQYVAPIKRMRLRQLVLTVVTFGLVVASALAIWKTLMLTTGSESPIVVVLSGSMEPAFRRGDLLFLTLFGADAARELRSGDVIVYKLPGQDIPIVHRITAVHQDPKGRVRYLTKGDANPVDDRGLYRTSLWVSREQIIGRADVFLPYVGVVTIAMNDYPYLKYVMIGGLLFFVLLNRE
eukprot:m51a1_g6924 putative signal peptidase complex catalytic subunit sec11c isoform x1 (183) ;mRNA; r:162645-163372